MASLYAFIKKHRRKLAVASAVAFSSYVLQRYLRENHNTFSGQWPGFSSNALIEMERTYIYESNNQTCNNGIFAIYERLQQKMLKKYDVEELVHSLKVDKNKLEVWNKMKLDCIARLLVLSYVSSLLVLTMKCQTALLAQVLWRRKQNRSAITTQISDFVAWPIRYIPVIGRYFDQNDQIESADISANHTFLQCIQFLVGFGFNKLCERVEQCSAFILQNFSLKDLMNDEKVSTVLSQICREVEGNNFQLFSCYVVPPEVETGFPCHMANAELHKLLSSLRTVLSSDSCRVVFAHFIDQFLARIVSFCSDVSSKETNKEIGGLPLAKMIPILSDAFHSVGCKDGTLAEMLRSEELNRFVLSVFES